MKRTVALIIVVLAAGVMAAAQNTEKPNETVSMRIPHVALSTGERIVGFEINLTSGMVRSASGLPIGWYLEVDNDPSWSTTIKGNISVGAAALDPNEFRKLRITVQKDTTYNPFAVSGTVVVTTDFEKTRSIPVAAGDFEVSKPK